MLAAHNLLRQQPMGVKYIHKKYQYCCERYTLCSQKSVFNQTLLLSLTKGCLKFSILYIIKYNGESIYVTIIIIYTIETTYFSYQLRNKLGVWGMTLQILWKMLVNNSAICRQMSYQKPIRLHSVQHEMICTLI